MDELSVVCEKSAERGLTEANRLLKYCIKHRCQIARRGVNDLQHLGGRGLLFQRLTLLSNQPHVFDRDHRLIGEGADQRDLLVGKGLHSSPSEGDDTNYDPLTQ